MHHVNAVGSTATGTRNAVVVQGIATRGSVVTRQPAFGLCGTLAAENCRVTTRVIGWIGGFGHVMFGD